MFICLDVNILMLIAKNVSLMFLKEERAEIHKCKLVHYTLSKVKILDWTHKGMVWVFQRRKL